MKKTLIMITSLLLTSLVGHASEQQEKEFLQRITAVVESGDFSSKNLEKIWLIGDTPKQAYAQTTENIKALKSYGIKESGFRDIFPVLLEGMKKPIKLEGKTYVPNLEPYKMIEIKYDQKVKAFNNGKPAGLKSGWTYVVGLHEGKLFLMGYKEQK